MPEPKQRPERFVFDPEDCPSRQYILGIQTISAQLDYQIELQERIDARNESVAMMLLAGKEPDHD